MAKILIVDDEKHILTVLIEVLESAGYETLAVTNGFDALKALEREPFDLALVDIMMPEMSGYHLVAKIHGLDNPPKVIIVTARNYEEDEKTVQIVGVSAFVSKPFSNKELLQVIATVLRQKNGR